MTDLGLTDQDSPRSDATGAAGGTVVHFSHSSDGGAGRAARRASLACAAAGLASRFLHVAGETVGANAARLVATPNAERGRLADALTERIQKEFIAECRTPISNTLYSLAYPGVEALSGPLAANADVVHLHWTTWGVTPRAINERLANGRPLFWTLHDLSPATGGCHYPAGCEQFRSLCLDCPQLQDDHGFCANGFAEKMRAYGDGGNLRLIAPSHWIADQARRSAIFAGRRIDVVRNPVELDVFCPRAERAELRRAFGFGDDDLVLMLGSFDLAEKRKGARILLDALGLAQADGSLAQALPPAGKVHLIVVGKSSAVAAPDGVALLSVGEVADDNVMADLLAIADLAVAPSLEDNYPNLIVEAQACGTPTLGFANGGVAEMIDEGRTGLLAAPAGSVRGLKEALVAFAQKYRGSTQMRAQSRAAAEANNDPARIGAQLRALYEEALGRPLGPENLAAQSRMMAALRCTPVAPDEKPGQDQLAFPANYALRARCADQRVVRGQWTDAGPTRAEQGRARLLTLRTRHAHHATRSGPAQFLRHLPRGSYDADHLAAPLDATLLTGPDRIFRKAGALMGAPAFGRQANSWLAEAELMVRCGREKVDLVHFIDGDLAGFLLPGLGDFAFHGGVRPAMIATYHQPPAILADLVTIEALARMDAIVALCETQRDFLARLAPAEKIHLIPHGVDVDFFHPPKKPRPTTEDPLRLLLVGHWLRDIKLALEAFVVLRASGLDCELTVISPNPPAASIGPGVRRLERPDRRRPARRILGCRSVIPAADRRHRQ